MRPRATGIGLLIACAALPAAAESGVDGFRATLQKWVETRQILSKEKSDWDVEKQTLRDSRDLLLQQKKGLQAEIADLESSSTAADDERRDLLLQRGEYQRVKHEIEQEIRSLEEEVLALAPRLPEPLKQKLDPLLVQIPEDPEKPGLPPLSQRLMNVLGVLDQAEKFNSNATFVGETRSVDGGPKVRVRTLYWGLGQAVYVDAQGETAGVGRPGEDGWQFADVPGLAGDAGELLDIFEGDVDVIRFVELPVEVR
jgi:hypothetical protein